MEKILLPTEQAELAKATARVVEAERILADAPRRGLVLEALPAIAIASAVYILLGDLEASRAARILLAVVSAYAVSAAIELRFMRKRLNAVEALVKQIRIESSHRTQ